MDKPILYIVRGCPGAGKSTLAHDIAKGAIIIEADQYFIRGGKYNFNALELGKAHGLHFKQIVKHIMEFSKCDLCVANTFMIPEHVKFLFYFAELYGYDVKMYHCVYNEIDAGISAMRKYDECMKFNKMFDPKTFENSVHNFKKLDEKTYQDIVKRYEFFVNNKKNFKNWNNLFLKYKNILKENKLVLNLNIISTTANCHTGEEFRKPNFFRTDMNWEEKFNEKDN